MEKIKRRKTIYELIIKRPMDFILSLIAIILLSPILLIVTLLVRIKLGNPVLFKQKRIGRNNKSFTLYKFRTMTNQKNQSNELLPDSERLTKFGIFLRKTSLDELPELWNILTGKMSIIGPRPLVLQYLPYFTSEESMRHLIRPGLTGFAQVNGRNVISWEERFRLDLKYLEKITFTGDMKIIIKTVLIVFRRENIGERNVDVVDFNIYRENQVKEK